MQWIKHFKDITPCDDVKSATKSKADIQAKTCGGVFLAERATPSISIVYMHHIHTHIYIYIYAYVSCIYLCVYLYTHIDTYMYMFVYSY